jgi:hypothetical protein
VLNAVAAGFVEGVGADSASDEPVAWLETDCRREVGGVVIGCWARVGGVVGPFRRWRWPNMASMVGCGTALKGVKRKSEGRHLFM